MHTSLSDKEIMLSDLTTAPKYQYIPRYSPAGRIRRGCNAGGRNPLPTRRGDPACRSAGGTRSQVVGMFCNNFSVGNPVTFIYSDVKIRAAPHKERLTALYGAAFKLNPYIAGSPRRIIAPDPLFATLCYEWTLISFLGSLRKSSL